VIGFVYVNFFRVELSMSTGIYNLDELGIDLDVEFESMAERKLEKYITLIDSNEDEE